MRVSQDVPGCGLFFARCKKKGGENDELLVSVWCLVRGGDRTEFGEWIRYPIIYGIKQLINPAFLLVQINAPHSDSSNSLLYPAIRVLECYMTSPVALRT